MKRSPQRPSPRRRVLALATALALAAALVAGSASGRTTRSAAGPTNTRLPSISGTPRSGSTLVASPGSWSGSGAIAYAYQWQRCAGNGVCGSIAGATSSSYRAADADVGNSVRVEVTATDSSGSATAASAPVAVSGAPPVSTAAPVVTGTARVGANEQVSNGTWAGSAPISYTYQWRRCNTAGQNCSDVAGATHTTYTVASADLGATLVAAVTAKNAAGSATATSAATPVVVLAGSAPAASAPPLVTGTAQVGQTLSATSGSWTSAGSLSYAYQWQRCDAALTSCVTLAGATSATYAVVPADVGARIRVAVTATNAFGAAASTSAATATVSTAGPAGAITLASGAVSIPVTSVAPPDRLVISRVAYGSPRLAPGRSLTARFLVTDTRGNVVRDALVYVLALPSGLVKAVPETNTGRDGWASVRLAGMRALPSRRGHVYLFVRARKQGDSLLAGVSSRRLVQLRTGR